MHLKCEMNLLNMSMIFRLTEHFPTLLMNCDDVPSTVLEELMINTSNVMGIIEVHNFDRVVFVHYSAVCSLANDILLCFLMAANLASKHLC